MPIRSTINDLSRFALSHVADCKVGDVFIHLGRPWMRSIVNSYNLIVDLGGGNAPITHDIRRHTTGRKVAKLLHADLELRIVPSGDAAPETADCSIAGCVGILPAGTALFGNFAEDPTHQEAGRAALILGTGETIFHNREFPFTIATWEISWVDKRGKPVLTIIRDVSAPLSL